MGNITDIDTYMNRTRNCTAERPRVDALIEATENLLAAIDLTGVAPADPAAREVWESLVQKARDTAAAFRIVMQ